MELLTRPLAGASGGRTYSSPMNPSALRAPGQTTQPPSHGGGLATARWEALGTGVVLQVTDPLWLPRAILARELEELDRACSRLRSDSDLSRVNALAGGPPVRAAPLLIEALQVALRAAELTDGDVDPTVGAALVLAGYDRDWSLRGAPRRARAPLLRRRALRADLPPSPRGYAAAIARSSSTPRSRPCVSPAGSCWTSAPPPKHGPPTAPPAPLKQRRAAAY